MRFALALVAFFLLAAPGEPYQCESDLQCVLANPELGDY